MVNEIKHTPGPWSVRERRDISGELRDCFVQAPDVNGFAYGAEILGDDEYHEQSGGINRKLADCKLIAAAPELLATLESVCQLMQCNCSMLQRQSGHLSDCWMPEAEIAIHNAIQKATS